MPHAEQMSGGRVEPLILPLRFWREWRMKAVGKARGGSVVEGT